MKRLILTSVCAAVVCAATAASPEVVAATDAGAPAAKEAEIVKISQPDKDDMAFAVIKKTVTTRRAEINFYDVDEDRNTVMNIAAFEAGRIADDSNKSITSEHSNEYKDVVRFVDNKTNRKGFVKELTGNNREVVKVKENGRRVVIKVIDQKKAEVVKTKHLRKKKVIRIPKSM